MVNIEDHSIADSNDQNPDSSMHRELPFKAINGQKPDYREPLLQVIDCLRSKEIAKTLEVNINTVMTRLFRARSQLKEGVGVVDAKSDDHQVYPGNTIRVIRLIQ